MAVVLIFVDMANGQINKSEQKATVSALTGLTPQQEQACLLLANGEGFTCVAEKLNINRGTLYKWQQSLAFRCFYNQQCQDYKDEIKNGIIALHKQAIETITELMKRGNENTRLKAAIWVIERTDTIRVGSTDIREVLKQRCTKSIGWNLPTLDVEEYEQALKDYNLNGEL